MALLLARSGDGPAAASPSSRAPAAGDAAGQREAIGWWALQFTPRVAHLDDAIVLDIAASLRLFGGEDLLRERIRDEALAMGCTAVAWAPSAHAAVALARRGVTDGFGAPLAQLLDRLPLDCMPAVAEHAGILARTGCKTIGDVRRLPRGGLSRRFGKALLLALDQAYGMQPSAFDWLALPEVFRARLELPGRVDFAEGLMFGARRLLSQMAGWLAARHAGVTTFTLRWRHESHRGRDVPDWGELEVRTAEATRDITHFARLLSEQLAKCRLGAGVDELVLVADHVVPLEETSKALLLETKREGESATHLVERLSARLGAERVVRAEITPDHRPEWVQAWRPATETPPRATSALPDMLQPTWLLDAPLRLALRAAQPVYQGALHSVAGPYRVEAGWWDRQQPISRETNSAHTTRRDYFVMSSEFGALLWVFRDLGATSTTGTAERSRWYLHGIFG